jgi:hypothetical protein
MRPKDPYEVERARIAKTIRTLVRLVYSNAADDRINELVPHFLTKYDEAFQRGQDFRFSEAEVLEMARG